MCSNPKSLGCFEADEVLLTALQPWPGFPTVTGATLWAEQTPALGAAWSSQSEGDDSRLFAVWLFPPGRS